MNKDPKKFKKDLAKLDMMDGVEEEILDRNTERRCLLLGLLKKRTRRKTWIPILAGAACFCLLFATVFLFWPDGKQVPIYQGMSVSSTYEGTLVAAQERQGAEVLTCMTDPRGFFGAPLLSVGAYSPFERSVYCSLSLTDTAVFTETELATETETESTLTGFAAEQMYFAKPGQDVYITIHFSNPDKFEILSFILNGEKYSDYMFEEGSDLEHLVLKRNVGNATGVVEFTIDAIKYVDGSEIKDVRMDGERTVKVGVYEDIMSEVTVERQQVGFDFFSFDLTLEDRQTLMRLSETKLSAVLYEGETVAQVKELSMEELSEKTAVVFDGLRSHRQYRCAVEAVFDALDGEGSKTHLLWNATFETEQALFVKCLFVDEESAAFSYEWAEDYSQKEILSAVLLRGDAVIRSLNAENLDLNALLSGTAYRLRLTYRDGEGENTEEYEFETSEKITPTVKIQSTGETQTGFDFEILTEESSEAGLRVTGITLICPDGSERALLLDVRHVEGLYSGLSYGIHVTYTYDLNDGVGARTETAKQEIKTIKKTVPDYEAVINKTTQTAVFFEIAEQDPDSIGSVTKIELLKEGEVVQTAADVGVRSFEGLHSGTHYGVRVTYIYDLNDGKGTQTEQWTNKAVTRPEPIVMDDIRILGETTLLPGESATLIVTVKNPDKVTLTSLTVNGQSVTLERQTDTYYMGSYTPAAESGLETLTSEEVVYTCHGVRFTQEAVFTSTSFLLVRGTVTIESISLSQDGIYFEGDEAIGTITFKGSEAYTMKQIRLSEELNEKTYIDLTKVNDTTYTFSLGAMYVSSYHEQIKFYAEDHWVEALVTEFESEELEIPTDLSELTQLVYMVFDKSYQSVTDISTPEQLQTMESGKAYRLVNHIDMSGFDWTPYDFRGILYGNGYEIRNLTVRYTTTEWSERAGMFTEVDGYLKDLVLTNMLVAVIGGDNTLHCSAIGRGDYLFLDGCRVEGDVIVIAEQVTVYAYGLSGDGSNSLADFHILRNCHFEGSISVTNQQSTTYIYPIAEETGVLINCTSDAELIHNGNSYQGPVI